MARNGFKTMVNTTLRDDGKAIFKDVKEDTVHLAESMGWRVWDDRTQPTEAKAFDPVAARLKEEKEIERLQARVDRMLDLGLKPDMKVLRQLSDADFEEQLSEFLAQEQKESQGAPVEAPPRKGRPKAEPA